MKRALILSFSLLLFVGCSQKPAELSGLVPVTITLTDGGAPVPGMLVSLRSEGSGPVWSSKAETNAQGKAKIESALRTHTSPGAPVGSYKIVFLQTVELPDELKPTQAEEDGEPGNPAVQKKRDAYIAERMIVPPKLRESSTSPIELTVEPGKPVELAVDLAEYR